MGVTHAYSASLSSFRLTVIVNVSAYNFIRKCTSYTKWHRTTAQWTDWHLVVLATQVMHTHFNKHLAEPFTC